MCIPEPGCCCVFVPLFFILLSVQFSNIKIFVTLFSGAVRPSRLKFVTHADNGWIYRVYRNHAAAFICPFIFFILLSLQFSSIKTFFVTLFSGTVRPRRLKLGTHVDSEQMYCVYWNRAAATYSSLYFVIFLSNFQALKFFLTLFSGTVRPRRLKLGTHMDSGQMYRVDQNQTAALIHPFISSFFLSTFQTLIFFVTPFSGTMRPRMLKLGTHMDSGQMYRVYQNQAAAAYSSLYFLFFFPKH